MLGFTECANCSDDAIAKSSPVTRKGDIVMAKFTSDANWETDYDSKTLSSTSNVDMGIKYIKDEIKKNNRAVVIGVHYSDRGKKPRGNNNKATYHFMVVVGYGEDDIGQYFKFYDPGRTEDYKEDATTKINKLYTKNNFIEGEYRDKTYTITEIVKYN